MAEIPVLTQSSAFGPSQNNAIPMTIDPGQNFFMIMPYLGTPRTPYYDSKNVTDFLDHFSDLCADYKLLDKEKMRQLPRYYDMKIG